MLGNMFAKFTRPFAMSHLSFNGAESAAGSALEIPAGHKRASIAAGCFWGVEHLFRKQFKDRVGDYRVGYVGGNTASPSYRKVCSGSTGHAEALLLVYDPQKVTYRELLEFFFKMHDPTTKDRQGGDVGTQYRSGVFYFEDGEEKVVQEVKEKVQKEWWKKPITTEVAKAGQWWDAEDYHQKYLDKNPGGYECPAQ